MKTLAPETEDISLFIEDAAVSLSALLSSHMLEIIILLIPGIQLYINPRAGFAMSQLWNLSCEKLWENLYTMKEKVVKLHTGVTWLRWEQAAAQELEGKHWYEKV